MRLGKRYVRLLGSGALRFLFFAGVASALQGAVIFTFDNEQFSSTPFTDAVGNLSATFKSSGDPFTVDNGGTFFSFAGNGFILLGPATTVTLTVSFIPDLSSVSMNFGTVSTTAFNLSAFENG